jgi:hypothetical protein
MTDSGEYHDANQMELMSTMTGRQHLSTLIWPSLHS